MKKNRHRSFGDTADSAPVYLFACPESGTLHVGMKKVPVPSYETLMTRDAWAELVKHPEILSEALGTTVTIPDAFDKEIERVLTENIRTFLPLMRKMGGLICGFEKCRVALRRDEVYCLLQASDSSERERSRLTGGRDNAALCLWNMAELGRVFGRDSSCHVAVTKKAARGAWQAKVAALLLFSEHLK